MLEKLTRRDFLGKTGKVIAGIGIGGIAGNFMSESEVVHASENSPNDKIVVGFIGCGCMGMSNLKGFMRYSDVEIAAVCDVYQPHLDRAVEETGGKAEAHSDFRRVLDRKDIDAVVISTPDHWHAIPAILACQSRKDAYIEKPLSHTIAEGRTMVKAARDNDRIAQLGTQQRSGAHFQRAVEIIRSGKIGKITLVRCWNVGNKTSEGIGNPPDCDPPDNLDWDMWLGPAPMRQYNPNRCIYHFRWFWDYAGGQITNWGVHMVDIVHWAMEVNAPLAAAVSGGKYVMQDNAETPDTMEAVYDYPNFTMVYSYSDCTGRGLDGKSYGLQFYGTNGALFLDRRGFQIFPDNDRMDGVDVEMEGSSSNMHGLHVRNFLDCVKSRELPISDVEIGHRSSAATILGNIAYKTGRKIHWDAENERIIGDPEASKLLSKANREPWII